MSKQPRRHSQFDEMVCGRASVASTAGEKLKFCKLKYKRRDRQTRTIHVTHAAHNHVPPASLLPKQSAEHGHACISASFSLVEAPRRRSSSCAQQKRTGG
eukprot:6186477-Pleurochrysis_carterae.AAC.3